MSDKIYKKKLSIKHRRWSKAAKYCYERGAECCDCIYDFIESDCKMRKTILELVKIFGKPKNIISKKEFVLAE